MPVPPGDPKNGSSCCGSSLHYWDQIHAAGASTNGLGSTLTVPETTLASAIGRTISFLRAASEKPAKIVVSLDYKKWVFVKENAMSSPSGYNLVPIFPFYAHLGTCKGSGPLKLFVVVVEIVGIENWADDG